MSSVTTTVKTCQSMPDHTDFTDGFSESIGTAVNVSEEGEHPLKNPLLKMVLSSSHLQIEVQKDRLNKKMYRMLLEKQPVGSTICQNDPFASTIIGLVVLIVLLGGVFLMVL